jgi:16S rRNA processing protein RimM
MSRSPADEAPWRPERVVVGRIGRPHGLDGAVHLEGHGGVVPLAAGDPVRVGERDARIRERRGTAERPILRLDLAADRDGAEALRGCEVSVPAGALPPPAEDEYFHVDLIGCEVRAGVAVLGTVRDVHAYPANDVLEVEPTGGGEAMLLPFAADVVVAVDVGARRIEVREGFV